MAFPTVVSVTPTAFASAAVDHDVAMPPSVNEGDLLLAYVAVQAGTTAPNAVSGWTRIRTLSDGAGAIRAVLDARRADGSEDGTTVNWPTTGVNSKAAALVYRITGWRDSGTLTDDVEVAVAVGSTSANPDPQSLNPSAWDVEDTLWIALAHLNASTTISSYPTNYTNGQVQASGGTGSSGTKVTVGAAERNNAVAAENPGAFTFGTSASWGASVVAIRPAGGSVETGSFTADAILRAARTGTLAANAVLHGEISQSLTADAVLRRAVESSFTVDAVIGAGPGPETGSDTVMVPDPEVYGEPVYDATLFDTEVYGEWPVDEIVGHSFTADAVIRRVQSASLTADAVKRLTRASSFTVDAVLAPQVGHSFTADAVIRRVRSASFTANAVKLLTRVSTDGSPSGTWLLNDVGSQTFRGQIAYGNGFWVVARQGVNPGVVMYARDPAGTWTDKSVGIQIFSVHFFDGYFYAVGGDTTKSEIWRAQDPTGTWTQVLNSTTTRILRFLGHSGSLFVAVGSKADTVGTEMFTSPDGETWTRRTGHGIDTGSSTGGNSVAFGDGYWALTVQGALWYTTDPTGAWTRNDDLAADIAANGIYYADGYWLGLTSAGRYRQGDPTGAFTQPTSGFPANIAAGGAWFANGVWVAVNSVSGATSYRVGDPAGAWTTNNPGGQALGTVAYGGNHWVTAGFTAQGTIRYQYVLPNLRLNAIARATRTGSFTADAVIGAGGTETGSFTADAIKRKVWQGSLTADAFLRAVRTGSLTADAEIVNRKYGSWAVDAVVRRTQGGSLKLRATIANGEVGTHIRVDGADITDDVLFDAAQFVTLVNGSPGHFSFRVRDSDRTRSFEAGAEVTLDIDGIRRFGGYLASPSRAYFFPVEDTTDVTKVERVLTLSGPDYNILFGRRVVYDKARPANVALRGWPAGTHDDEIIKYVFDHYTDLADDNITYDRVEHVGTPNPDLAGVVGSGGLYFGDLMREINRLIGAVWYISPDKDLTFADVDTPSATKALSDRPTGAEAGYREFGRTSNAVKMANDAMVWGAGLGARRMAFARTEDAASIAAHKRWQYGEFTTHLYKQASVQLRADTVVDGTPQNKRGGKDSQVSWQVTTFDKSFVVGQKVSIESEVWGVSDVVPIRRMTISWPTTDRDAPKFDMVLSHEVDEPWDLFEFLFPSFRIPKVDIPEFDWDSYECWNSPTFLDDFNRTLVWVGSTSATTDSSEVPGCASSGYPWIGRLSPVSSQASKLTINGNFSSTPNVNTPGRGSDAKAVIFVPLDPRHMRLTFPLSLLPVVPAIPDGEVGGSDARLVISISRVQEDHATAVPWTVGADELLVTVDNNYAYNNIQDRDESSAFIRVASGVGTDEFLWGWDGLGNPGSQEDMVGLAIINIDDDSISLNFHAQTVEVAWTPTSLPTTPYLRLELRATTADSTVDTSVGVEEVRIGDLAVWTDLGNCVPVPRCGGG